MATKFAPIMTTQGYVRNGNGRKTHLGNIDTAMSLCGIPERFLYSFGDEIEDIESYINSDVDEELCKFCKRSALKTIEKERGK